MNPVIIDDQLHDHSVTGVISKPFLKSFLGNLGTLLKIIRNLLERMEY